MEEPFQLEDTGVGSCEQRETCPQQMMYCKWKLITTRWKSGKHAVQFPWNTAWGRKAWMSIVEQQQQQIDHWYAVITSEGIRTSVIMSAWPSNNRLDTLQAFWVLTSILGFTYHSYSFPPWLSFIFLCSMLLCKPLQILSKIWYSN